MKAGTYSENQNEEEDQSEEIDNDLKQKLRNYSLDPHKWGEIFRKKGIKTLLQLKYVGDDLSDIVSEAKYNWEKHSLKTLCKRIETTEENDDKKETQFSETIEKVQNLMEKLTAIIDEKEKRDGKAFSSKEASSKNEPHKERTEVDKSGSTLAKRSNLTPLEVISQISAGRILRGTYIKKDMTSCVEPRGKMINIQQQKVDLNFPSTTELYKSTEYFNQTKSRAFDHVIQHWGLSAALGAASGFNICSMDIGFTHADTEPSVAIISQETDKTTLKTDFSEIKEFVAIKTASFSLEDVQHFISDEVIDELKKIDKEIEKGTKRDDCYTRFFEKFGSHYYTGTYHFGGIFIRSVKYHSKEHMKKSETLKLVKTVIQGSLSRRFEISADASNETSKDEDKGNIKKEEDDSVRKEFTMIGGPPEVDQISLWKFGLVVSNKTWGIVDKDHFKEKWRGVWELMTNKHKPQIKNIKTIREEMQIAWENSRQLDISNKK